MRSWKGILAGMAVGIAVSAAVFAQQKSRTLTQEDYAAIQRLYAQYNWALDSHAEKGWALRTARAVRRGEQSASRGPSAALCGEHHHLSIA